MRIKRYLVSSMQEAKEKILLEMGKEAVIISSRKVRQGGLLGFFKPSLLEVTAVVDEELKTGNFEGNQLLLGELKEIKTLLQDVNREKIKEECHQLPLLKKWGEFLRSLELSHEHILEILNQLKEDLEGKKEKDQSDLILEVRQKLTELLPVQQYKPKKIKVFIGPTGAGKTTTLAKLAAKAVVEEEKKIGLITIDTYRIGAVDQLQTYADILDVPFKVVLTPKEISEAMADFINLDNIFIDTAGHPFYDRMRLTETKAFLNEIKVKEVFLVLSAATKDRDLLKTAADYAQIGYDYLIFTRLDETKALGSIVNVAKAVEKPVIYVANGQRVPDDLIQVSAECLAELILGTVI